MTEADFAADALLKRRLGGGLSRRRAGCRRRRPTSARLDRRALHHRRSDRRHPRLRRRRPPLGGLRRARRRRPAVRSASFMRRRWMKPMPPRAAQAPRSTRRAVAAPGPFDPLRFSAAGPKPILQAMAARLGATIDIAPRVPSLAYRLCMAARGAIDFAAAAGEFARLGRRGGRSPARGSRRTADRRVRRDGLLYNRKQIRRGALLAAPEPVAQRLLEASAPRPAQGMIP